MRLTIKDVAIHQKNGLRWAQLPAKPQMDRDGRAVRDESTGKVQYTTLMEFDSKPVRDAFSAAVINALLEFSPGAFDPA